MDKEIDQKERNSRHTVLTVLATILFPLSFCLACSEAQEHTAAAINDRDSVSVMRSYGVNTLISDSGVIKYRIVSEQWDVNTVRQPPRWEFMKGVFFEQFDEQFHVQAYIQADTAWYFDQQKLWKLRGRVRIRNVNGLLYQGEELYWDGLRHEFYSYVFSKVITPERTLEGTRFRSNERMTHYSVSNSKGSFIPEDHSDDSGADGQTTDSTQQILPPQRPAATKHARTTGN